MKQKKDRSHWTFEDYFAFFLVYAAEADLVVHQDERDLIVQKVGEERFSKFLAYYLEMKDVDRIDMVYEFKKKYCQTEEDSEKALASFKEVLTEDHEMSALEQEIYMSVRKILKA